MKKEMKRWIEEMKNVRIKGEYYNQSVSAVYGWDAIPAEWIEEYKTLSLISFVTEPHK